MAQAFANFYDHVFAVLSVDATIIGLVPNLENIRPSEDKSEPLAGPVIHYHWESSRWQRRQKRGTGRFSITAADHTGKVNSTELMEAIAAALTEKALTAADSKVRVPLFAEAEAFIDSAPPSGTNRLETTSEFDVRLVEVT